LLEAIVEKVCVVLPEITQHPKVRAIHPSYIHKGKVFVAPFLYLPRTKKTLTVGIYKDRDNQAGVVSILPLSAEPAFKNGCVKLLKNIPIQVAFVII
jgi:hypothetical protein